MVRKLIIFLISFLVLVSLILIYNYFTAPKTIAPEPETKIFQAIDLKEPSGLPYIKGPTGPPPTE